MRKRRVEEGAGSISPAGAVFTSSSLVQFSADSSSFIPEGGRVSRFSHHPSLMCPHASRNRCSSAALFLSRPLTSSPQLVLQRQKKKNHAAGVSAKTSLEVNKMTEKQIEDVVETRREGER